MAANDANLAQPDGGAEPLCVVCGNEKTARGGDIHCNGDCDAFSCGEPNGCHEFVPPELTPTQQPDGGARRQVSPGDLGAPIKFEIETVDGWIIRFDGEDAAKHCRAIDAACAAASIRGMTFPEALPSVYRAHIPPVSPERTAVYRAVDAFIALCATWPDEPHAFALEWDHPLTIAIWAAARKEER